MASQPPPAGSAPSARALWKDWWPAMSVAAVLFGAVLTGGGYIATVKDDHARLDALEAREAQHDRDRMTDHDALSTIDVRTARIEAKIEVLLPVDRREARP
jgi:hypothetical protein